ncbi:MAG: rod shape-determining protein RodA [Myxococcota bacterium]
MMARSERGRRTWLEVALERLDWPLLSIIVMLASVGIINLYSAAQAADGPSYHVSQAIAFTLGMGVVGVLTFLDTRLYERWAYVLYVLILGLLALVLAIGTELNGSKRWLNLGVFLMQPSELLKIGVILITARFFHDHDQDEPYSLSQLAKLFALVGVGVVFVLQQPDLGTSLTILAIFMTMVLFQGVRTASIITMVTAVVMATPLVWTFGMKEYQKDRVRSFLALEQDAYGQDWQVRQSIIAFGSGRLWGKGYLEGTQIQKGFVPEHENDFAAANWGEEHGFAGMLFLLSVYMALIMRGMRVATRARSRFAVHVAVGMSAFIFWHVMVNLGMVTGMLPVVGLPLPLMSYGRSNLMTVMLGLGLLMNVSAQARAQRL